MIEVSNLDALYINVLLTCRPKNICGFTTNLNLKNKTNGLVEIVGV